MGGGVAVWVGVVVMAMIGVGVIVGVGEGVAVGFCEGKAVGVDSLVGASVVTFVLSISPVSAAT